MINYYIYRLGQFIAMHLPIKAAYKIAVFCSDVHFVFADKDRRHVKENLKVIFPDKSDKEINKIRIGMFRNFAKYLVDFFRFQIIDKKYIEKNIRIENLHYFEDALARKKGAIILTAHFGNWELGGIVIALLGYPFWAVALQHKEAKVNQFFNRQRESKGVRVIQLGKAVRTSLDVLKKNELVALVGDRDFTSKGVILDFFGKPTLFPEGPAAFSLKTGAPIVPGFMLRNKDDSFTLKIEKPLEFVPSQDKKKDLTDLIKRYKMIFEDYIRKYPDQWYMFRRFWADENLRNNTHI